MWAFGKQMIRLWSDIKLKHCKYFKYSYLATTTKCVYIYTLKYKYRYIDIYLTDIVRQKNKPRLTFLKGTEIYQYFSVKSLYKLVKAPYKRMENIFLFDSQVSKN